MGVVPVVNVSVDLVPDPLAFDLGTIVEVQCSSCEVPQPQDPGVLLVGMVSVSLADQVLVQCDLGVVSPPLWCDVLDGVVELRLLLSAVQDVRVDLGHLHRPCNLNIFWLCHVCSKAMLLPFALRH
jgi:hypothetical protein